jgi:glycosyltransferase involved in cell wall biosynthesis/SAM-dependent methyltransferase
MQETYASAPSITGSTWSSPETGVCVVALIPAYQPGTVLIDVVQRLASAGQKGIVVVDDGSGPEYTSIFEEIGGLPQVQVIRQAFNSGKGSALKAGVEFILRAYPEVAGIVTADADGQHDPADIRMICERFREVPEALVLGVRCFDDNIPLRSRVGNRFTRRVMRMVLGHKLSDSQTGLRAIPLALLQRLPKVRSSGYEFELEMLIAAKHMGLRIVEQPIRTIYEPGNPSSHFRPFRDSLRIGYVLLRFSLIGLMTAVLDNLIFYLLFQKTGNVILSQAGARIASVLFNYQAVRRAVFLSDEPHAVLLPRYLLLVAANCCLSYMGIMILTTALPAGVYSAKVTAETLLFFINLTIQREWIFTRRANAPSVTDWDLYYRRVPLTARLTRKYTQSVLISAMKQFADSHEQELESILELGGANSCFVDGILAALRPRSYDIVDRNEYGLALIRARLNGRPDVTLHKSDILALQDFHRSADCVFSVGLVEHFDPDGTRKAIQTHFDLLRKGGCAIISFPTPTWLYTVARSIAEALGAWRFHDERPLRRDEVMNALQWQGKIIFEKTLWPLVFTQHLMVVRKK